MRKVAFLNEYKKTMPFYDCDGNKLFNIELSAITQANGMNLYICQEGDEPYEPDSHSSIKIPLLEIIKASMEWREGDYGNKHNSILGTINELEYIIKQLHLEYKDLIETKNNT